MALPSLLSSTISCAQAISARSANYWYEAISIEFSLKLFDYNHKSKPLQAQQTMDYDINSPEKSKTVSIHSQIGSQPKALRWISPYRLVDWLAKASRAIVFFLIRERRKVNGRPKKQLAARTKKPVSKEPDVSLSMPRI